MATLIKVPNVQKRGEDVSRAEMQLLMDVLTWKAAEHVKTGKCNWMINTLSDEAITFFDFSFLSSKACSWFCKKGFQPGDTVWVSLSQSEYLPCLIAGVWKTNGIIRSAFVEDAYLFNEEKVYSQMKAMKIRWIICNVTNATFYLDMAIKLQAESDRPIYVITNEAHEGTVHLREIFNDDGLDLPAIEANEDDSALIFSPSEDSSGGAMHTHKSVLGMLRNLAEFTSNESGDKGPLLLCSNLTHLLGILLPFSLLYEGRPCMFLPKVERMDITFLSNVSKNALRNSKIKHKPTGLIGYPSSIEFIAQIGNVDWTGIESIFMGGKKIKHTVPDTIRKHFRKLQSVTKGYWLRETGIVTSMTNNDKPFKITAVTSFNFGRPLPGVTIKIKDYVTGETLTRPNLKGEIFVKTTTMFKCYNPDENTIDLNDEWFQTGDYGYKDENGCLHVLDRLKAIKKSSQLNTNDELTTSNDYVETEQ